MNNAALDELVDPNANYVPEVNQTKVNMAYQQFEADIKAGKPKKSPANKMRDMKKDELNVLRLSVLASGLLEGITIDERGRIVDGWHRVNACLQLHHEGEMEMLNRIAVARVVPAGLKPGENKLLELGLNGARRHLTNADLMEQTLDAGLIEKKVTGKSKIVTAAKRVDLRGMVMKQFICKKSAASTKMADARERLGMTVVDGHRYTEAEARSIIKEIGAIENEKRKGKVKVTKTQSKRKVAKAKHKVKTDAATEKAIEAEVKKRTKSIPMPSPTAINCAEVLEWVKDEASEGDLNRVAKSLLIRQKKGW